jgi:hypothetical protein
MDKRERKKFGAWISLMGGSFFVLAAVAAAYIAFAMPPDAAGRCLAAVGRTFHRLHLAR